MHCITFMHALLNITVKYKLLKLSLAMGNIENHKIIPDTDSLKPIGNKRSGDSLSQFFLIFFINNI